MALFFTETIGVGENLWFPMSALIILVTSSNFHKKSVPKQTTIAIARVDNFSLVSLRFSVP